MEQSDWRRKLFLVYQQSDKHMQHVSSQVHETIYTRLSSRTQNEAIDKVQHLMEYTFWDFPADFSFLKQKHDIYVNKI